MRQGTGKVKHLSAKILWIQDRVRHGEIVMSQIGTAFNVADMGTKVLSAKRFKTLLRDIGIFDDDGASTIQVEECGGAGVRSLNQQVMQAVRTIARLAILMGLEPTPTAAATTIAGDGHFLGKCAIDASTGACGAAETAIEVEGGESEGERAEDQMLLNPDRDLSTPRGRLKQQLMIFAFSSLQR